jgi:hypothetical protein
MRAEVLRGMGMDMGAVGVGVSMLVCVRVMRLVGVGMEGVLMLLGERVGCDMG